MSELPIRKPTRHPEINYRENGSYFITICTQDHKCVLARIVDVGEGLCALPQVILTKTGQYVEESIRYINQTNHLSIDQYVIMPNHIHMIITLDFQDRIHESIISIIGKFKSYTTHQYGKKLWQRSFYDHQIRSERAYLALIKYIQDNPVKWAVDKYNPS